MWLLRLAPYLLVLSVCPTVRGYSSQQGALVRLVGGRHSAEGRVEVQHGGQWGTVCDDGWGQAEAQVVCRQLGFTGALKATQGGAYGQGSGPIWLDDLSCEGTETFLASCRFKGWGVTDCTHKEDAGVICERDRSLNNSQVYPLNHVLGLPKALGELWDSGRFCDLTLLVRSPGGVPEEERVCTHSVILSLHLNSSFLKASLESKILTLEVRPDCRPYVPKILRYLYTSQIDITLASATCIHWLASQLALQRLQEDSGRLFVWLLPQDPSFQAQLSLHRYAVETGDLVLQDTCLRYLAWNCQRLVESPAWGNLSRDGLQALLTRSDLVIPGEAFLLRGLESWVRAQQDPPSSEDVASLLEAIRFPMIPAEQLFDLRLTSDLYVDHESLFLNGSVEGFQFNSLPFAKLKGYMEGRREQHTPRIYTSAPWSLSVNFTSGRYQSTGSYFQTPVLNSVLFHRDTVSWATSVCLSPQECRNRGYSVYSTPIATLSTTSGLSRYSGSIRYSNKIVLSCDGEYIFHIQGFKSDIAQIITNASTSQGFPCYTHMFSYLFVVSPEYIF